MNILDADKVYRSVRLVDGVRWATLSSVGYHKDIDWSEHRFTGQFYLAVRIEAELPAQVEVIYVPDDAPYLDPHTGEPFAEVSDA